VIVYDELFPILGGRLLKMHHVARGCNNKVVSNPWREAIEEREAERRRKQQESFQSLEGGY